MKWRFRPRWPVLLSGVILVVAGLGISAAGLYLNWVSQQQVATRQSNDNNALGAWDHGGASALAGAASSSTGSATASNPSSSGPVACGGGSLSDAYALVEFSGLPAYGYAGVAVDGNWTRLIDRSMVHWHGSPAPGGAGNVIIAFHREPDYQHIDQLSVGDTVTIQDRSCHSYVYTVTQRWQLAPGAVSQLVPTSGHELTLITCTPWWIDSDRLVWRADLTAVDGAASVAPSAG